MTLYTIPQVAAKLAATEYAVGRLLATGQLPYVDVCVSTSGKKPRKRVKKEDLDTFIRLRTRHIKIPLRTIPNTKRRVRKALPPSVSRLL